ncbi:hypothetical protein M758_11G057500 [Ceratodon purpureus]|nr:hypothetical protein M758_11G057500 [Ceratodon purpureus]KAG0600736.1 hypothetical protein M758_11G057500 [Ceratodon purpureus]
MLRQLRRREVGADNPRSLSTHVRGERVRQINLSGHKEVVSAHHSGINSLQVDCTEARYLLAGAADGSVGVYDTQQPTFVDSALHVAKHEALFTVDKSVHLGHIFSVSSVQWYPVDTGLFVTGSYDKNINLWDTNTHQVELQFKMPGKVYAIAMSAMATTHMLVAAGTEDVRVRLCDLATGACTHTLSGHRDGVWALQWSASSEWILYSGGCDGAIRFWDIRRAGCFQVLDHNRSQIEKRPSVTNSASQRQEMATATMGSSSKVGSQQREAKRAKLSKGSLALKNARAKESAVQRQHPGMMSANDRSTAHNGSVTALQTSDDGLHLFSAGTDSRVRLWDIESGCNTLVNYEATRIRAHQGTQLAVSMDSSLLFVASAHSVQVVKSFSVCLRISLALYFGEIPYCTHFPHNHLSNIGSADL